ncbi:hypothetical protein BASA50_002457 [Batrachochytrium salamandrivorans]|uniref:Uncharacterized protein n=1 Tax=Batrachochytrium salamandrivorans TaxID=1357716 RepID=A0ABQ8FP66_9FUNG|nr:hypothetical protein BASA60_003852 [Batrachochytrium salamandrivorans]KAH6600237.1 hypothetical protein BASA50_002457 [Batrachochytrium salamandrivorans]KAH6602115.1 hypothetical protein BASA61_001432 [Batrachochytrium salamandrivorans]
MDMAAFVLYEMTALDIRCDFSYTEIVCRYLPMSVVVIIAGAKAAYDQIYQQSFDTEEPLLLGYIVQGASPSLAKRR